MSWNQNSPKDGPPPAAGPRRITVQGGGARGGSGALAFPQSGGGRPAAPTRPAAGATPVRPASAVRAAHSGPAQMRPATVETGGVGGAGVSARLGQLMGNKYLLLAAGGAVTVVVLLALLFAVTSRGGERREQREAGAADAQKSEEAESDEGQAANAGPVATPEEQPTPVEARASVEEKTRASVEEKPAPETTLETPPGTAPGTTPPARRDDLQAIEIAAVQVMRRVSRDNITYSYDEKTLRDISLKLEEYSNSPQLRESMLKMQGGVESIATRARREGLEPSLVAFASLAIGSRDKSGRNPVETARTILPALAELNKTLGSSGADSSLILLAAYSEGAGSKRSHPLLTRIRKLVRSPLAERNVWFLHDNGVIDDRAYDLVINFLACGIIAQDPGRFGLEIDPLSF